MQIKQIFKELDGYEIRYIDIESDLGVILIQDNKIIIDGKAYPEYKITKKLMNDIWNTYIKDEVEGF